MNVLKSPVSSTPAPPGADVTPSSDSTTAGDTATLISRNYPALSLPSYPEKIIRLEYAVRGKIAIKADEISRQSFEDKPYKKVLQCNIGNPQALGLKPLSYIRETLSMVACPNLLEKDDSELQAMFRKDCIKRARRYAAALTSAGAYTHSLGNSGLRAEVADFFERRDGVRPDLNRILLTNGASEAINTLLTSLISCPQDGVLLPLPQYPLYAAAVTRLSGTAVYYELDEEANWSLNEKVLSEAYERATLDGIDLKILAVINPGNPCPTFLQRDQISRILRFAEERNMLVIADEVYQENIYGSRQFTPFRKVLLEDELHTQLASLHSASKGYYGECGLRAGVCHLDNVDDEAFSVIYKLRSIELCSNTLGQVVITSILNPPQPGDDSYELYLQEKTRVLSDLKEKAKIACDFFATLEGVTCVPIDAGMYAFPRLTFPKKAVEHAASLNLSVENFYCLELLDATGIATTPGEGFGQKEGTHHVRMTILPQVDDLRAGLDRFEKFHKSFLQRFQ
eukprot:Gregarina_sp_Poly_1__1284@NODE_1313_length_4414_cov_267_824017_g138_i1_p1_GENE_NODE_1313_length_4414_cov_267_824017_g138_i1NODE_1313_length_4414_cov_267_824017_g138_i1_p1_ORF_typecomplete_len512_score67_11Aminotran_1_2/PF00155_21/1_3e63DegT_DnrJ_EryC1/PF01041_17/8_4e05Alliinase_C/PF04864_13/34Alliinase_C/PF04864_13/2_7Aminotran_5/PF00266_19/0_25_NODE_1313_length_4414_cov_267_824017_g138_i128044339